MSKPDIIPKTTTSGIAVDPRTLERVVPESRRSDGTVRKEIKIRPGFTPQEDVRRFRGTRQVQMDANALPKGHIIGWVPPSTDANAQKSGAGMSKSAKKNAKRKEKKVEKKEEKVKDSWEDDDEDEQEEAKEEDAKSSSPPTKAETSKDETGLAEKLEKLDVQ